MTDWTAVARARKINISDEDIGRTLAPLTALETALEILRGELKDETEPAFILLVSK